MITRRDMEALKGSIAERTIKRSIERSEQRAEEKRERTQQYIEERKQDLFRDVESPIVNRAISNCEKLTNMPRQDNYFRRDRKGITPVGIFFTAIVFFIVFALFLGGWMNEAVASAIETNNLSGWEAIILASFTLIVFLLMIVLIIVGTAVWS